MATRGPAAPGGDSSPPSPSAPRSGRRRPSLYVTVLSLAIAAIAATWLPFSVLYISALSQRAPAPAPISTTYGPGGATASHGATVTTRTSTGAVVQSAPASAPAQAAAATPVTSRAS